MKQNVFYLLCIIFSVSSFLSSQELDCQVTVNLDIIQPSQRNYLRNFQSDIERYMNSTRFTNEDLDGEKIQCNLDITFQSASSDDRYTAKVVVVSQRPVYAGDNKTDRTTPVLRILDNSWEFPYMPNQRMNHDEMIFDPLTSFLDFYAYLIIGYDLETYVPMSGSQCFQKANRVVQLATTSAYSKDWGSSSASYSKYGITDELASVKYNAFRTAFNNYYFDGIDILAIDQQKALKVMLKSIEDINDVRRRQNPTSVLVKQFFDAKYREIAEAFFNYPDRQVYETLSNCDQEHRQTYQEWKMK